MLRLKGLRVKTTPAQKCGKTVLGQRFVEVEDKCDATDDGLRCLCCQPSHLLVTAL